MKAFVFLGPSLDRRKAEQVLDATYLPPVASGDLLSLVERERPSTVVIVDGYFARRPAVWHKEILFAIDRGVRVVGASSMGALRAAELDRFGMFGVGSVYEKFKSGEYEDDDEVALLHAPVEYGYRPSSEAMVNIRHGLALALNANVIDPNTYADLIDETKAKHYSDRTWASVFEQCTNSDLRRDLARFIRETKPDIKGDDALLALTLVAEELLPDCGRQVPFEPTVFWFRLEREVASNRAGAVETDGISDEALWVHLQLRPDGPDFLRQCLGSLELARAAPNGSQESTNLQRAFDRLRSRRGLLTAADTNDWRSEQRVSDADALALAEREDLRTRMLNQTRRARGGALMREVRLALKMNGTWHQIEREILEQERREADPSESLELDETGIVNWYQQNVRPITGTLASHCEDLGFDSVKEFLRAAARAWKSHRHVHTRNTSGAKEASWPTHSCEN